MKKLYIIIFILSIIGCKETKTILAKVNNQELTKENLRTLNINQESEKQFVTEWINLKLLACSIENNKLLELKKDNYETKLKANIYISKLLENEDINKNELLEYYNANYQNFYKEITKYKFQKIFVSSKNAKNNLINDLSKANGSTFSDLAKKYSEEIYGKNGGYTGFVDKESIRPLVWDKLTESEKGKYYWIDVPDGYVIGRWYEKKDFKIQLSFDQVKNKIIKILKKEDRKKIIEKELQKLRKTNKVEINLDYN